MIFEKCEHKAKASSALVCKVIGDSGTLALGTSNYIGLDIYFNSLGQICIPTSPLTPFVVLVVAVCYLGHVKNFLID